MSDVKSGKVVNTDTKSESEIRRQPARKDRVDYKLLHEGIPSDVKGVKEKDGNQSDDSWLKNGGAVGGCDGQSDEEAELETEDEGYV